MSTEDNEYSSRVAIETAIIERFRADKGFSESLLADPETTLAAAYNIPKGMLGNVVVVKETPGEWVLVIPSQSATEGELTDDALENVSGGVSPLIGVAAFSALAGYIGSDAMN
jgi:hypothetical protein